MHKKQEMCRLLEIYKFSKVMKKITTGADANVEIYYEKLLTEAGSACLNFPSQK